MPGTAERDCCQRRLASQPFFLKSTVQVIDIINSSDTGLLYANEQWELSP